MEAVQDHSAITDPFGIGIFVTIARFVAADTQTGWASDRTVAELARCDKDSVAAWRQRLLDAGEIETWTTGGGRGTRRYYKILLPFNEPKFPPSVRDNSELLSPSEGDNNQGDIYQILAELRAEMSQMRELLSRQIELLSRIIVGNVPPRTGQDHHDHQEEITGITGGITSAEPPPAPPSPQTPPAVQPLAEMVNALSEVTGMSGHLNWSPLATFAQELLALDYQPDQVCRHYGAAAPNPNGHWGWYRHDWRGKRGDRPTLTNIRQTISGAVNWQPPANGAPQAGGGAVTTADIIEAALGGYGDG